MLLLDGFLIFFFFFFLAFPQCPFAITSSPRNRAHIEQAEIVGGRAREGTEKGIDVIRS